jgi:hypothetical protein
MPLHIFKIGNYHVEFCELRSLNLMTGSVRQRRQMFGPVLLLWAAS